MARKSKVEMLLSVDPETLMNMSRKDMAKNVSILASAANKRLKRLELSGTFSPAAEYVKTHGGKFSVAGKNQNQLMIEYFRLQSFLESKTSSVSGAKKWQRTVQKEVTEAVLKRVQPSKEGRQQVVSQIVSIFNDPKKKEKFWDLYSRLSEEYEVKDKYKEVWDDIADAIATEPDATTDDIFELLTEEYEKKYQSKAPSDPGDELRLKR